MTYGDIIIGDGRRICLDGDGNIALFRPFVRSWDIVTIDRMSKDDYFTPVKMESGHVTTERHEFTLSYESNYLTSCSHRLIGTYTFPEVSKGVVVPCPRPLFAPMDYTYIDPQDGRPYIRTRDYTFVDADDEEHENIIFEGIEYSPEILAELFATRVPVEGSQFGATKPWEGVSNAFWKVMLAGFTNATVDNNVPLIKPVFDYHCILLTGETGLSSEKKLTYDISHVVWGPDFYTSIDTGRSLDWSMEYFNEVSFQQGSPKVPIVNGATHANIDQSHYNLKYNVPSAAWKQFTRTYQNFNYNIWLPLFMAGDFTYTTQNGNGEKTSSTVVCTAPTYRIGLYHDDYFHVPNRSRFEIDGAFKFPFIEIKSRDTYRY